GADLTALATTGIENLRPYLVGYVPQLLLSATVTPLCLLTIAFLDPISAVIAIVTLPLVPIFMILVGKLTMGRSERLIADMRSLWTQLLDLVDGLPTLRALGRERGPEKVIATLGQRHRASAMGSLKYAFLSSMVLELLATLCVALIAVSIGMRLVYGEMDLAPALAVLVLAPEVYQPLRNVGSQYHSSTDGLAAVTATFEVLAEQAPAAGSRAAAAPPTSRRAPRGARRAGAGRRHHRGARPANLHSRAARCLGPVAGRLGTTRGDPPHPTGAGDGADRRLGFWQDHGRAGAAGVVGTGARPGRGDHRRRHLDPHLLARAPQPVGPTGATPPASGAAG